MKLIVGLGNPGPEYSQSRHNTGFMTVNSLAETFGANSQSVKGQAMLTEVRYGGDKLVLAKPLTFMNNSGFAVRALTNWYKIDLCDLLIIYDDMDLPLGRLRLRKKGSAGSHNGMKSIVEQLGTQDFPRLRVGIGRPPEPMDAISFVLGKFTAAEKELLEPALTECVSAVKIWTESDLDKMMAYVNGIGSNKERKQSESQSADKDSAAVAASDTTVPAAPLFADKK